MQLHFLNIAKIKFSVATPLQNKFPVHNPREGDSKIFHAVDFNCSAKLPEFWAV